MVSFPALFAWTVQAVWERERQRLQEEYKASMMKECTFRPTISAQSEAIIAERRSAAAGAMAVHVRLYGDAERIRKKQEIRLSRANVRV